MGNRNGVGGLPRAWEGYVATHAIHFKTIDDGAGQWQHGLTESGPNDTPIAYFIHRGITFRNGNGPRVSSTWQFITVGRTSYGGNEYGNDAIGGQSICPVEMGVGN